MPTWPRYDALMAFGHESKVLHGFRKPMLAWRRRRALALAFPPIT